MSLIMARFTARLPSGTSDSQTPGCRRRFQFESGSKPNILLQWPSGGHLGARGALRHLFQVLQKALKSKCPFNLGQPASLGDEAPAPLLIQRLKSALTPCPSLGQHPFQLLHRSTSVSPSPSTSLPAGEPWILSIETTGRVGAIAAVPSPAETPTADALPACFAKLDSQAARDLLPAIDTLLKTHNIARSQLTAVAVTAGPGSFTGSRIGVTAAKSIAYALGIPTLAINTQDAIAAAMDHLLSGRLWIALDAQRGDLFLAQYQLPWELSLTSDDPTRLTAKSAWLNELAPGDLVTGQAGLQQELPSEVAFQALPTPENVAVATGRLGWKLLEWGETTIPFDLVPRYYRESAAEENRRLA